MFTLLPMENDGENHDDASPWLMPGFQASLRGKKIPKPSRMTVTNILSKFGNTQRSWDMLFDSGSCTMNQILMNFRTLMLLNFPINKLREYWDGLSREQAPSNGPGTNDLNFIVSLLKIRHLINLECDASYVARIVEKISESQHRLRSNDSGEQSTVLTYQISEDECKIEMPEKLYTDKKGNLFGAMNQKVVSTQFCNDTVLKYKDFLDELLNNGIETLNLLDDTTSNVAIYPGISNTRTAR